MGPPSFSKFLTVQMYIMQLTDAARRKRRKAWAKHVEVGTNSIRWTQVSINNRFGNSLPIEWTIAKLRSGEIIPRELPLIRVAKFKGKYRSVDNRRLYCYKTAGIKKIPVIIIKEDRKMKQLFEKNKSKNNGVDVKIIDIPLNPKNLDTKVITYDPTNERAPKAWTVRQAIQELEAPEQPEVEKKMPELGEASPSMETSVQGEVGEAGEMDQTKVQCGETEGDIICGLSNVNLQTEGSDDTGLESNYPELFF